MSISVETLALAKKNTKQAVEEAVTSVYKYRGSVETFEDLPTSGQKVGDVYNVEKEAGRNYAWDGSDWDALGIAENLGDIEFTGADSEIKTINEDFWDKDKVQEELDDVSNDIANTSNALNNSINEVSNVANAAYESASNANNSLNDLGNIEFSKPSSITTTVTKDLETDKVPNKHYVAIKAREVKDGKITIKVTNNQDLPAGQYFSSFFVGYGPTPQQAIGGPGGNYTPSISSNVDEYIFTIDSYPIENDYYVFIKNEVTRMGQSIGFSFQGTLEYETETTETHTINNDYYDKTDVDNLVSNVSNQATCAEALARSASNEATAIRNNFSNIEFTGFKEDIETVSHNLTSNYVIVNQETGQKSTIGVPIEGIVEEWGEEWGGDTTTRYMYLTYTCESEIFDNWEIGDYDQFDVVVGNSERDVSYTTESQDFYKIGEKQIRIPLSLYASLVKGYTYVGLPLQDWAQRDLFSDLTQVTWSYNRSYYLYFTEGPVTLDQDYYTKGQMKSYIKSTQRIINEINEDKEQKIYQSIGNTSNLAQTAYNAANAATNLAQDAYNRATEKWGVVDTYTTSAGDSSISLTIDKEYEEYLVTFNHPCKHDGPDISNVFTNENPIYTAQMGGTYIFSNTGGVGNSLATYPTMEAYYKLEKIQGSTYLVTAHSKNNLKGSFAEDSLEDIFTIILMYNSGIHLRVDNGAFEEGIVATVYGKHGEEVE